MKKSLLLAVMAIAALTASAEDLNFMNAEKLPRKAVIDNSIEATANSKIRLSEAPAEIAGNYVSMHLTCGYDTYIAQECLNEVQTSHTVTIEAAENGYTISGLLSTEPVNATYANGVISIAPGQVSYTSTYYGDCLLYVSTKAGGYYDETKNIEFEIDEDGVFNLKEGFGLIIVIASGQYEGYYIDDCKNFSFALPNGTSTENVVNSSNVPTSTDVYNTFVELYQDEDGKYIGGVVAGMWGEFFDTFTIDGDKVKFEDNAVYFANTDYKNARLYQGFVQNDTYYVANALPEGTIDVEKGEINLGMWIVALESAETAGNYGAFSDSRHSSSVITFPKVTPSAVNDVNASKSVKSVEYVNLNGQISSSAFEGINIVVTNYTDGTRTATKVVK